MWGWNLSKDNTTSDAARNPVDANDSGSLGREPSSTESGSAHVGLSGFAAPREPTYVAMSADGLAQRIRSEIEASGDPIYRQALEAALVRRSREEAARAAGLPFDPQRAGDRLAASETDRLHFVLLTAEAAVRAAQHTLEERRNHQSELSTPTNWWRRAMVPLGIVFFGGCLAVTFAALVTSAIDDVLLRVWATEIWGRGDGAAYSLALAGLCAAGTSIGVNIGLPLAAWLAGTRGLPRGTMILLVLAADFTVAASVFALRYASGTDGAPIAMAAAALEAGVLIGGAVLSSVAYAVARSDAAAAKAWQAGQRSVDCAELTLQAARIEVDRVGGLLDGQRNSLQLLEQAGIHMERNVALREATAVVAYRLGVIANHGRMLHDRHAELLEQIDRDIPLNNANAEAPMSPASESAGPTAVVGA